MKSNKLFLATLATAIAIPAIIAPAPMEAAAKAFKDVPTTYYAHKEIMDLVNRGVINGFSDGTFKPTKQVTRAEFAAFVARALNLPSATSNFKDVPKSAALYDGVSRANKAGIIKGFSTGYFKPNTPVSRQDMAVMLDRAMQLKGSYTKTKALNFSDKAKVGAYAKTSVERLYYYNVMGAFTGTSYQPTTIGTRAETAKFIYNMLTVVEGGKVATPPASASEIEAIKKKDPLKLTHAEVVKAYGPYEITRRYDMFGETRGIQQWDIWETYMVYLQDAKDYNYKTVQRPDVWLKETKEKGFLSNVYARVNSDYPNYEIIALNGVPFEQTELLIGINLKLHTDFKNSEKGLVSPTIPLNDGEFKVELHYKKNDFVTYYRNQVKVNKMTVLPYSKDNKALMVDVKSVFANAKEVELTSTSIKYGSKTVKFTNGSTTVYVNGEVKSLSVAPEMKSGVQMVPIREVAEYLGLVTRVAKGYVDKIEIQNYSQGDIYEVFK